MTDDKNKRKLYDALSQDYDMGSYEQFSTDVEDEGKRRKLYDAIKGEYDLPDFDGFTQQLIGQPTAEEEQPASAPSPASRASQTEKTEPVYQMAQAPGESYNYGGELPSVRPPKASTAGSRQTRLKGRQEVQKQSQNTNTEPQQEAADAAPLGPERFAKQMQMDAALRQRENDFHQRMENIRKGNEPFGSRKGVQYNPATGKVEDVYYTKAGEAVSTPIEQRQRNAEIDEALRPPTVDEELQSAYDERDSIDAAIAKRTEELDAKSRKQYDDMGFWARMAQGLAATESPNKGMAPAGQEEKMNDPQLQMLWAAKRQNQDRIGTLERERGHDGFVKTLGKTLFSLNNWDFGLGELMTAGTLLAYGDSKMSGAEGEAKEAMMRNTLLAQEAEQRYGSNDTFWQRAGEITGSAIPFVVEFVGTGGGYSAITKGATKMATKAAAKMGANKFGTFVLKNTGRLAGDMASGLLMANTTGSAKTMADIMERHQGQVVMNENGDYSFDGGKSWSRAIYEGEMANTIEYFTEKLGSSVFDPVLGKVTPQVGRLLTKGAEKIGAGRLSTIFGNIRGSEWIGRTKNILGEGGIDSYLGEVMEEESGILLNAMLTGDNKFSDLWDKRTQADIWGGMMMSIGFMKTPSSVAGTVQTGIESVQYHRFKHNTDIADRVAESSIGGPWGAWRDLIDGTTNEKMADVIYGIIDEPQLDEKQKGDALNYIANLMKMRGYNLRTTADAKDQLANTDEDGVPVPVEEATATANEDYTRGYEADENERRNIVIDEVMGDGGSNPAAEGMRQRIEDDADLMVAEEREEMKKRQHGDGTVHPATLKELDGEGNEKQVFIVDGNVVMDSEGNVDLEGSDRSVVVYDPEIGKRRIIDPTGGLGVSALGEVVTQEMFEADLERRKQSYIQQQMDDAQGKVSVAVGETVTVPGTDAQGTVVAVSEDGEGLTVQLEDGTQVPVVRGDLQEVADRQAIEEYEATRAEQTDNAQPEPTATMVEGAPESYEPGMTITIRDYDGQEKQGVVKGRGSMMANDGRLEYVPDGTGNIVEYEVDGEVRRDRIDQMGEKVVGYSEAVETAPVNQEEPQPVEEVAETEQTAEPEATEAEPMPMFEDGEADFMATTPQRGHQYIYGEAGLSREEAGEFVKANIAEAEKNLSKLKGKAPKMGTSLTKYQQEKAAHQQQVEQAQAVLDYWNGVRAEQQRVVAAERAEQAERDRAAHDAAVLAEQERQAEKLAKQQEQAERGANAVHPAIREKWDAAAKVEGAENEITLANGETLKGWYMLVESGAATPSHNATSGFARSEGFPVDENGQTVNDRDYERDQNAQLVTRQMADQYDSRAIQNVPVVSRDGVVLSGNGRTMAGELAARQNSDGAYIEHLRKYPQQFGFTPEQVEGMQHPRVVFVPDVDMPYTTETFAKFNQQDMKSQSRTEQSVKMGKTVDDATFGRIVRSINAFDTLGDFYNDPKAAPTAIGELHKAGVINQMQVAEMMDGEKVSGQGRQMLENMLIGKAFEGNPDAVRQLAEFPAMRQSIVSALAEVANNIKLGEDYSLESEMAQAINLAYQARKSGGIGAGEKVSGFARQQSLFPFDEGETVADYTNATVLMLADCLNDGRVSQLKKVLAIYNDHAAQSAAGQYDIFSGGVKSKEEIINDVLNILNNGTETEQQTALAGAAERRKEAAGVGQDGVAGNSDAGSGDRIDDRRGSNGRIAERGEGEEIDENGRPFVKAADGTTIFGEIREESGLTPAPIKLSEGYQDKNGKGYGLAHIEANHGSQIREAGFNSVEDFVSFVAQNYDEDNIRVGKNRINGSTSYLIQVTDKYDNTLFIELSRDGSYWNVNSGGIFRKGYANKKETVVKTEPQQPNDAVSSGSSLSADETSGISSTEPTGEPTVSERKDTNNSETEQEKVVSAIKSAEAEVDTNPTEGQKKAGNYKMGHVTVDGYDITIENPKGSVRRGTDPSGKAWEQEMHNTYGYIRGTEGVDGDHIDVFLSDDPTSGGVYVVDQVDPQTGEFDEHKVMYGFGSRLQAEEAYLSNYEKGWKGLGEITYVSKEEFKKWIESSHRKTKPFVEYRGIISGAVFNRLADGYERGDKEAIQKAVNEIQKIIENEDLLPFDDSIDWDEAEYYEGDDPKILAYQYAVRAAHDRFLDDDEDQEYIKTGIKSPKAEPYQAPAKEENEDLIDYAQRVADGYKEFEKQVQQPAVKKRENKRKPTKAKPKDKQEEESPLMKQYKQMKEKYPDHLLLFRVGDFYESFSEDARTVSEVLGITLVRKPSRTTPDKELAGMPLYALNQYLPRLIKAGNKVVIIEELEAPKPTEVVEPMTEEMAPLSVNDMAAASDAAVREETATEQPTEEQQPESYAEDTAVSKSKWVDEEDAERFEELKRRLRATRGQLNMGVNPEQFAIGVEMSFLVIKHGARKFGEYAKQMIDALGDWVRPYLKSFYNGARDLPEMAEYEQDLTSYDDVRSFDVMNFDKEGPKDIIALAKNVVKENEVAQQAEEATVKLKRQRSERQKSAAPQSQLSLFGDENEDDGAGVQNVTNEQVAADVRKTFSRAVTADLLAAMERGEKPYRSIGDLRKRAESVGMTVDADGRDDILLQELVEDGLVRAAREVVESGKYGGRKSKTAYESICRLYDLQPTISQRSSNRIKMQQYSTPLPMAFVADMFAYKPGVTTILEPTAGNGMLVFAVPANDVVVNELDETRLANLREQGFLDVKNLDALGADFGGTYDAVIANPPFGNAEAKMYDGKEISGLDPQITLNALSHLKTDGRAAIIIGGNMEYASNGSVKDKKPFWTYLYNHYNVKGVVDMDGKLYAKQGTTYPTRMILIDGIRSDEDRAQSTVYPPKQENAVRKAETFEDLYDIVNEIINSKEKTNGTEVLRTGSMPVELDTDAKTGRTNTVNTDRKPDANADNGRNGEPRPTDGNRGGSGNRPVGQKSVSTPTQPSSEGVRQSGDAVVSGAQADNGGRPVSSGESGRGERGGDTGRVQPDGVRGAGAVGGGVRLGEEAATVPQHTEPEKRTFDEEKLSYRPHNSAFSLESVAPAAMVEAMDNTLSEIEKTYGQSVDQFVTEQLGYDSEEEMHKALAAEQVDSVAMALHQMSQGNALIIGDQTGVGKGRQMAALIRWAVRAGKKPIFITQKADLFSDIYRDLVDVGSGDLRPFIFNSDGAIVDSNGAVVHKPLSSKEQLKIFADGELPEGYDFAVLTYSQVNTGDRISRETKDANGKRLSRGKSANKDNRDKPAPKADFLRQISRDNYLFLDESHTAAGDSNIGAYIRSIIGVKGDGVKAVTFASATFAKRPDTMPMYALRTAMSQANVDPDKLISIIEKGGVTLQEIMSRALTESGQMVRRERDMSDVRTDWETVTDPVTVKRARDNYDKTIEAFNAIIKFQEDYVKPMIDQLDAAIADRMETAQVKRGTNKMGVENVPFASKTYNYTKQLMLALKADAIVDRVEQEIKAGRHPVIALESTMEASLKDYAIGEAIDEPTFSASLLRGLDNCMQYTIKDEDGKETHRRYKPSDLGPEGEQAYYQLQDLIREATKDVFISPLDAIIENLNRRGYKVGELTGRNVYAERDSDGKVIVKRRTDRDKKRMQREFNSGALDVLILNKSASTGISLHASSKFTDQRQRSMIIAQPLSDINDYMQMIGRIDRTGQVSRGYYINLGLPVPAESRFLMMLSTKLKSLNANTTTSQDSESSSVDAPDLLNKYGSQVVVEYLRDNPSIYTKMGDPLKLRDSEDGKSIEEKLEEVKVGSDDAIARKITGYVALLSTAEQEAFYNDVVQRYTDLIKYLDSTGTNDLKITVMPLRAKTVSKRVSSEGKDPDGNNPFACNAYVEQVEMDVLRKPMKADEVRKLIEQMNTPVGTEKGHLATASKEREVGERVMELVGQVQGESDAKLRAEEERYEASKQKAQEEIERWREKINGQNRTAAEKAEAINLKTEEINGRVERRHAENTNIIKAKTTQLVQMLQEYRVGNTYLLPQNMSEADKPQIFKTPAIFCGYKVKKSGITPSTSFAVFATLDGRRRIEVKFTDNNAVTSIRFLTDANWNETRSITLDNWDSQMPTESRKKGFIMTGNILQAVADTQDEMGGYPGQLISYSDEEGNIHDGILMPDSWEPSMLRTSGVPIEGVMGKIRNYENVESQDGKVSIYGSDYAQKYFLEVPKTKKEGAQYYENAEILRSVTDGIFYPFRGGKLRADIPARNIDAVVKELGRMGVRVKSDEETEKRRRMVDDSELIERLESEPKETGYRNVVLNADGTLGSPMASKLGRKGVGRSATSGFAFGSWEQADENPDMATDEGKIDLIKPDGKAVGGVDYNPYIHIRPTLVNKQFKQAWERPNLVYVETEYPSSELTSGYRAEKAKKAVGRHDWNGGELILSRWDKPVRIVPWERVADDWEQEFKGEGIPFDIIPPRLLPILAERGMEILPPHKGMGKACNDAYERWKSAPEAYNGENVTVQREGETGPTELTYGDWFDQGSVERIGAFAGYSRRRIDAMKERQKASVRKRLEEQIEKMGLKDRVVMVESADELGDVSEEDRRSKGWYDVETGKIVIVLDNHTSSDDVIATILHEGVAHYGLRQLFGKHFDTFLDNVYASATEEVRGAITNLAANKYGWNIREATEEYIAGLAEDTDFESPERQSWWAQIKRFFWDMLHKLGIAGQHIKDAISDNELRYLLWRSYQNLVNPGRYRSLVEEAEDIAMQWNLQVGRYEERYGELRSERAGRWYAPARAAESGIDLDEVEKIEARPEADGYVSGVGVRLTMTDGNTYNLWVQTDTDDGQRGVTEFYGNDDEGVPDEEMTQRFGRFFGHDVNEIFGSRIGFMLLESARVNRNGITLNREQISQFKQPSKAAERMHRDGDGTPQALARDSYERMLNSGMNQFKEAVQDSMLSLKKLYESVLEAEGAGNVKIEEVKGYENAYLAENRMHSSSEAEIHAWQKDYMEPIVKAVHALAGSSDDAYEELIDYMMAKHGLERNEVFARRDADRAASQGKDWDEEYSKNRERDYAGLTSLTGEKDVAAAEREARKMVDYYENGHDSEAVDELWKAVNNATRSSLRKTTDSGLMSADRHQQVRDMFEYYIPLQGFDSKVAEDVYAYMGSDGTMGYGTPIRAAKGRVSKADDPLATIAMNGEAAIRRGNRNLMKQHFLRFVEAHPSDLVSVSDVWLRHNDVTDEWEQYFDADLQEGDSAEVVAQKVEAFEQKMEQLSESDPDHYKRGRDLPNVPYRVLRTNDMSQHQVVVMRNGKTVVLTINGSPRAAQALNGLTNPDVFTEGVFGKAMNFGQVFNRQLSLFYTTRNPEFVLSNFLRDAIYSNTMSWVKESPNYAIKFHKNFGRTNPVTMGRLFAQWENGSLRERVTGGSGSALDKQFYEFMMNGGETGWTNMRDIEKHKKDLEKAITREGSTSRKVWKALGRCFDLMNRSVENCARFAAFVTSRQMGRSIERSIWDAKEVSVNFNKKGAGDKFLTAKGQRFLGVVGATTGGLGRGLYVFFNASLQGLNNIARATKRHPWKAAGGLFGTLFTLGAVIPLLSSLIGGDDDDDDKNNYYNLPEYIRRSNICFRWRSDMPWVTIPLPIEYRAIYGLGELATGMLTGNERYSDEEAGKQVVSQLSQVLPLDFMEGGGGWHAFVPSQMKPFVEANSNKSWTGLPIYRENKYRPYDPQWTRAYQSANKQIVEATRWLNEATGGDDVTQGWIDWNPAKIEYMLKGYLGGYFTMYDRLQKTAETVFGDREFEWRNIPMASRVLKEGDERTEARKITNDYFNMLDEYKKTDAKLKGYEKIAESDREDAIEYAQRIDWLHNSREYTHYLIMDAYQPVLKAYYDKGKEAEGDEKQQLKTAENALRKQCVDLIHAVDDGGDVDVEAEIEKVLLGLLDDESVDVDLKKAAQRGVKRARKNASKE